MPSERWLQNHFLPVNSFGPGLTTLADKGEGEVIVMAVVVLRVVSLMSDDSKESCDISGIVANLVGGWEHDADGRRQR